MKNKEVILVLRKEVKAYIGIVSQSLFSQMCIKIENDLSKPATVKKFFGKFGYIGDWNNFHKETEAQRLHREWEEKQLTNQQT